MRKMEIGLPIAYMTWCGNMINKLELGFFYEDADAAEWAKEIAIPTLVINSEADEVTPYFMGKDIYDSLNTEDKVLWTVPDSAHANQWLDYNEEYCINVLEVITGR